jgi:CRISPR/Cas system CMR-associated protein Cmr1 (group 7 of RAMP superfamily)
MGCVASFNKHCDVCICLLKEYKGEIKKNNYINSNNKKQNKNTTFYKIKLNKALDQLNKDVKYQHESEQLKELNEIYQKLLSLDSERNKNIYNENDINNLNQVIV